MTDELIKEYRNMAYNTWNIVLVVDGSWRVVLLDNYENTIFNTTHKATRLVKIIRVVSKLN